MKINPSCRAVTRLLLQSQDRPLGGLERASVQVHWLICVRCRQFRHQQKLMRLALDRWKLDLDKP